MIGKDERAGSSHEEIKVQAHYMWGRGSCRAIGWNFRVWVLRDFLRNDNFRSIVSD